MLRFHTVIIGSGAAGYAAADRLLSFGIRDIAMVTYRRTAGTSRNAGSDKQTYYKLSCTDEDSPLNMAKALSAGGGMHRDTALIEAAESLRCFMHLAEYGVPFPTDAFGRFIGYQTDHDTARRGSSAGPLTSRYMTECLENAVRNREGFTLLDHTAVIKIVTEHNRAVGLIALQKNGDGYSLLPIQASYIIAATGGAASVYKNTVYPPSQIGALGLLAEAGCRLCNLTEWQYGIASLGVKWNLSGSYQQVIPTYYSVDDAGGETEFLPEEFGNAQAACDAVFLKGYQWPFDSKKAQGSSRIDRAVSRQREMGRRVFMDFRRNPTGFDFQTLSQTAKDYLLAAGASGDTPYQRLEKLNPQALQFYKSKGVDLARQPLEIAVCAQHMNGGADVDIHWQTSVENLFAIGETAGTFGLYRPGGSALNSTQVGALRAAEAISEKEPFPFGDPEPVERALRQEQEYIKNCLKSATSHTDFSGDMSLYAAECRQLEKLSELRDRIRQQLAQTYYTLSEESYSSVLALYRYRETLLSQWLLCSVFAEILPQTGSRGGAVCMQNGKLLEEKESYRDCAVVTDKAGSRFVPLREFPDLTYSFEVEWQKYNRKKGLSSLS